MKLLLLNLKKASSIKKTNCLILILIFFLLLVISFPSLAKLKNRNSITSELAWNGEVATSYRSGKGTVSDPYIISNGAELAYFSNQLENNSYEGKFFELGNDIILNNGIFNYTEETGLEYILDNTTYYIGEYSNNYYIDIHKNNDPIGNVNLFKSLNNFKGNFDGKSFIIYGLYIADKNAEELGLFTRLNGNISNIYIDNAVVQGGNITGGVASTSISSNINNIEYQGYVLSNNNENLISNSLENKILTLSTNSISESLIPPLLNANGTISKITLTGIYSLDNKNLETNLTINDNLIDLGNFEIELGSTLNNPIILSATGTDGTEITLSNLKYNVYYNNSKVAGIVADTSSTNITNSINKADIYGKNISGGIVGNLSVSGNIVQSYNTGKIFGTISGGLVSNINDINENINITNCYSSGTVFGTIPGGLLGRFNSTFGKINITNSFNMSNNYAINRIEMGAISINNSYTINDLYINYGISENNFFQTTLQNLQDSTFLQETLLYKKFISLNDVGNNSQNVWIFESGHLPILYIDDMNEPIATINVGTYNWNNLKTELNKIKITPNISFSIENKTNLSYIKNKYYYISTSINPLTEAELNSITNWIEYDDVTKIEKSGYYVIYAKIVDYKDDITYINTDVLALDTTGLITNISLGERNWASLNDNINTLYINESKDIMISASSDLLTIDSIQYLISSKVLSKTDLENEVSWQNYLNPIKINELGQHIIYAKIIDSSGQETYINTDIIYYGGYTESVSYGRKSLPNNANYITDKSTINVKLINNIKLDFKENYKHTIVTNQKLPEGTIITLIDNKENKVYTYTVLLNDSFNFEMFKEIGTATSSKNFDESQYYNKQILDETYNIIINFENTNIVSNYNNLTIKLEIRDNDGNSIFQTLNNTIAPVNIYSNVDDNKTNAKISLNTEFVDKIEYNSNSVNNININENLVYKTVNDTTILDTSYEDKKLGLSIKLVDSDGNTMDAKYLNNMIFKFDQNEYAAEKDGTIRINFPSDAFNINKTLILETKETNTNLEEGLYYLKIQGYASYDGYYSQKLSDDKIMIPIEVSNMNNVASNFNVTIKENISILNKNLDNKTINFNITLDDSIDNPIITISLYKKYKNTAYDQEYKQIDLKEYTSNDLINVSENDYLIGNNPTIYTLTLKPTEFDYTGYKFMFTLYNGTKKISTIDKYFIVR